MSKTVDQRVVEMRFDNKQFEQNVATTMQSVDKLKKSLKFEGTSQGLDNLNSAAKRCDLSSIGQSAEKVGLKFNAMYSMADQALRNITNSAMDAGKRIVSALTIDPLKTGFSEYETKINAIQTIMSNTASKGTTMDDVTNVLGELNTYADKTIYNFAEMTRNIGTFTAAGVGLEDSAKAIQGISNLAAASGSTSQQASTAMYQLSQALSSGTVRLMDWNSVVNAGMGGEKFQEALKATAREHGVAVDDMIKKNGSFRESLSDGWLSADILNETLSKFTVKGAKEYAKSMMESGKYTQEQADALIKEAQAMEDAATKVKTFTQLWDTMKESAQSGWAQTWEIIIGDFEEAKTFLTEVSDTIGGLIGKSAEARNDMLENWKVMGGRADLLEAVRNAFEGITSIVKPIGEAFKEIFPPLTAEKLFKFTEGLKNLTAKLKLSDKTSDSLKRTFKGVFALIDIGVHIIKTFFKALSPLLGGVGDLGGGLLDVTAAIGDFLVWLNETIKKSNIFNAAFQTIAAVVKLLGSILGGMFSLIADAFDVGPIEAFKSLLAKVTESMGSFGESASGIGSKVFETFKKLGAAFADSPIFKLLKTLWELTKSVFSAIGKALGSMFDSLGNSIGSMDIQGFVDFVNGLISGGLGVALIKFIKSLTKPFDDIKSFTGKIGDILDSVSGAFGAFQNKLNAEALKSIAVAILILTASLVVLTFINQDKLIGAVGAITTLFIDLLATLAVFKKIGGGDLGIKGAAKTMIGMSISVLLLAKSLDDIAKISSEDLERGLLGIAALMAVVTASMIVLGKSGKLGKKGAVKIVAVTIAINLLIDCCQKFANMTVNEAIQGVLGVSALAAALSLTTLALSKAGSIKFTSVLSLLAITASIGMLVNSCESFSELKTDRMIIGLAGVAGLLVLLTGAELILSNFGNGGIKGAYNVISLAIALNLCVLPLLAISKLDWSALARGLVGVIGVIGTMTVAQVLLSNFGSGSLKGTRGLILMVASISLMIPALKKIGSMSWESLAKSMLGLIVVLASLVKAQQILSRTGNLGLKGAGSMAIMAAAIMIIVPPLKKLGSMSWEEIGKSLVGLIGVLGILSLAQVALSAFGSGGVKGAIGLYLMANAILLIAAALIVIAVIPMVAIAKGLLVIATTFTVLGIAGFLLQGVTPIIAALGTSMVKIGLGALVAGAGLAAFGIGLTLLSTGLVAFMGALITVGASIGVIAEGLVALISSVIVGVVKGIGEAIVAICETIANSASSIVDTVVVVLLAVIEALVEVVPPLVDALLLIIVQVLEGLVQYTPTIVSLLCDLLIGVLEALASKIQPIVKAAMDIVFAIIEGVIQSLAGMNTEGLADALLACSMLTAIVTELAAIALLTPAAMAGVVGLGVVVAELAVLLAAIGGIAQIPGLTWIVNEGGDFLLAVGTAIGKFVGGIAGGIAQGITSALPQIGTDLSNFMINIQPFVEGASDIDPSIADGVKALVSVIPMLAGANIVETLASIFTGGSSIEMFATQLPILGDGLRGFSESVEGVIPENIIAASNAAKALAEMASVIPNEGGVASWFAGENSIAAFAPQLVQLGMGLKGFSDAIVGIVPENIIAASNAAKALAEMADTIPNEGGVASWFAGDNTIASFAPQLILLGIGLKGFSDAVIGITPENIMAATAAAKAIVEMTNQIPNEGGVVSWFTGENSIAKFGTDIIQLGIGLKGFSDAVVGIDPVNIIAAATAGKALAAMTETIPNEGGMESWFTGEASISKFGTDIIQLGIGLKAFSDNVIGVNPEAVVAAANAAKALAEMTSYLPDEGGIVGWFAGEVSISKFGSELPKLGAGLKGFSDAVIGIAPETVTAGANAAKTLAEMTSIVPNDIGKKAWFSDETSMSKFSSEIIQVGKGVKGFSDAVNGITPESVTAGANAAKTLAEMTATMPKEGGIKAWFAGETSISKFGTDISNLGKGIKGFSTETEGINPENIASAANAAKALAEMTAVIPKEGGIKAWFTGETSISNFASKLPSLGKGLKGFSDSVAGLNPENVTAAADAAKSLGQMAETVPGDSKKIVSFGENLTKFGGKIKTYFSDTGGITKEAVDNSAKALDAVKKASDIDSGNIKNAAKAIDDAAKALKNLSKTPKEAASNFKKALKDLGETSVDTLVNSFDDLSNEFKKVAQDAMKDFTNALSKAGSNAEKTCKNIAKNCATAISSVKNNFQSAGASLVDGFAAGISANSYKAAAKAKAMAEAAEKAAKEALDINSPSKVFMGIGGSVPEGFAMGIDKFSGMVKDSSESMADTAIDNVGNSIAKLARMVESDIDAQPTIRPVLDLSDVKSGASAIDSLLANGPAIGVKANLGSISSIMNKKSQNGVNDDIISAIDKLAKGLKNIGGDSYTINGVSYDAESDVADAIRTITRAAKMERRM